MPLKKKSAKEFKNSKDIEYSGPVFEEGQLSIFDGKLPMAIVALSPEQFHIPSGIAVMSQPGNKGVSKHDLSGTTVKDENGKAISDHNCIAFFGVDAELAQTVLDAGNSIDGLSSIEVRLPEDSIELQKLVPGETILKPKKCRVRATWQNGAKGTLVCTKPFLEVETFEVE